MQDISIGELNLSGRAVNRLKGRQIFWLSQMMELTEADLRDMQNVGNKTVEEILAVQSMYREESIDTPSMSAGSGNGLDGLSDGLPKESVRTPVPHLVIHEAFPAFAGREIGDLRFRGENGVLVDDLPAQEQHFSVRTANCLQRNGIMYISEIARMRVKDLRELRGLGEKVYQELLQFLWERAVPEVSEEEQKRSEARLRTRKAEQVSQSILAHLTEHPGFASAEELRTAVVRGDEERAPLYDEALSNLLSREKIESCPEGYRIRLPHLEEWLISLSQNERRAMELRLEGRTLEECGALMNGITRERVRQLTAKALRQRPRLREDDLVYWFEQYSMSPEEFGEIFGTEPRVYEYLCLACQKGTHPLREMEEDPALTARIGRSLSVVLDRHRILIGDVYVPLQRGAICRELAHLHFSDREGSFASFYELYSAFLAEHHLADREEFQFPSGRAFESRMQASEYILMKYGRKFRYYPIAEYDAAELVRELHFEQLLDVEISTRKLFADYPEVMEEYHFQDEYELHNFLKKTQGDWHPEQYRADLTRMPLIAFGDADREKQAVELLYQVAPVTYEEYGQFYEMEYGMLAVTVNANLFQFVRQYYHDGMFTVDQPLLDDDERAYLRERVTEEFYFTEDIHAIYRERFPEGHPERINPRTLKELGFRVYAGYVIRDIWSSAEAYFRHFLMRDPVLDLREKDARLAYVQSMSIALNDLRNSLDLIEYEDRHFLRFDHLANLLDSLTKEGLREYVKDAFAFAGGRLFFNSRSLREEGFVSPLHELGFPDWFYDSLIRNVSHPRYVKAGRALVFYGGDAEPSRADFVRYVVDGHGKIHIDDLVEELRTRYGAVIPRDNLTVIVARGGMYYSPIMERVYISREVFYDDL